MGEWTFSIHTMCGVWRDYLLIVALIACECVCVRVCEVDYLEQHVKKGQNSGPTGL